MPLRELFLRSVALPGGGVADIALPESAQKGGPGSGFFGHAGRPGQVGGSAPGDAATAMNGTLALRRALRVPPPDMRGEYTRKTLKAFVARRTAETMKPWSPQELKRAQQRLAPYPDMFYPSEAAEKEQPTSEDLASMVVDKWAATSGDGSFAAVGIQLAAQDLFGLTGANTEHFEEGTAGRGRDAVRNDPVVRDVLRAQYEQTQALLSARGITQVRVYRGMVVPEAVIAGMAPAGETRVNLQPLSSFTLDSTIAKGFANDRHHAGIVMTLDVPASRVFSTPQTGSGCLPEQEVILLGGDYNAFVNTRGPRADWRYAVP